MSKGDWARDLVTQWSTQRMPQLGPLSIAPTPRRLGRAQARRHASNQQQRRGEASAVAAERTTLSEDVQSARRAAAEAATRQATRYEAMRARRVNGRVAGGGVSAAQESDLPDGNSLMRSLLHCAQSATAARTRRAAGAGGERRGGCWSVRSCTRATCSLRWTRSSRRSGSAATGGCACRLRGCRCDVRLHLCVVSTIVAEYRMLARK
jgi:hypothetical protein